MPINRNIAHAIVDDPSKDRRDNEDQSVRGRNQTRNSGIQPSNTRRTTTSTRTQAQPQTQAPAPTETPTQTPEPTPEDRVRNGVLSQADNVMAPGYDDYLDKVFGLRTGLGLGNETRLDLRTERDANGNLVPVTRKDANGKDVPVIDLRVNFNGDLQKHLTRPHVLFGERLGQLGQLSDRERAGLGIPDDPSKFTPDLQRTIFEAGNPLTKAQANNWSLKNYDGTPLTQDNVDYVNNLGEWYDRTMAGPYSQTVRNAATEAYNTYLNDWMQTAYENGHMGEDSPYKQDFTEDYIKDVRRNNGNIDAAYQQQRSAMEAIREDGVFDDRYLEHWDAGLLSDSALEDWTENKLPQRRDNARENYQLLQDALAEWQDTAYDSSDLTPLESILRRHGIDTHKYIGIDSNGQRYWKTVNNEGNRQYENSVLYRDLTELSSLGDFYDRRLKDLEAEQKERTLLYGGVNKGDGSDYRMDEDYNQRIQYNPDNLPPEIQNDPFLMEIYYRANNSGEMAPGREDERDWYQKNREYGLMTDNERNYLNYLLSTGDAESAKAYLDSIHVRLNDRRAQMENVVMEGLVEDEPGAGAALWPLARVTKPLAGVLGGVGILAGKLGVESAKDPNSKWYRGNNQVNNVDTANVNMLNKYTPDWMKNIGFELGDVYTTVTSAFDSYIAAKTGGAIAGALGAGASKLGAGITQFIMSSGAASSDLVDCLNKGMDFGQAALHAAMAGGIEALTESFSPEMIIHPDMSKTSLMRILLGGLTEGLEEVNGQVLEYGMDAIFGNMDYNQMVDELQMYGRHSDGTMYTRQEAEQMADALRGKEIIKAGVSGAASGGMSIGVNEITMSGNTRNLGKNILQNDSWGDIHAAATMLEGEEGVRARGFDPGKRGNARQQGQYYQAVEQAAQNSYDDFRDGTVTDFVEQRLVDRGVDTRTAKKDARKIAGAITDGFSDPSARDGLSEFGKQLYDQSEESMNDILTGKGNGTLGSMFEHITNEAKRYAGIVQTLHNAVAPSAVSSTSTQVAEDVSRAQDAIKDKVNPQGKNGSKTVSYTDADGNTGSGEIIGIKEQPSAGGNQQTRTNAKTSANANTNAADANASPANMNRNVQINGDVVDLSQPTTRKGQLDQDEALAREEYEQALDDMEAAEQSGDMEAWAGAAQRLQEASDRLDAVQQNQVAYGQTREAMQNEYQAQEKAYEEALKDIDRAESSNDRTALQEASQRAQNAMDAMEDLRRRLEHAAENETNNPDTVEETDTRTADNQTNNPEAVTSVDQQAQDNQTNNPDQVADTNTRNEENRVYDPEQQTNVDQKTTDNQQNIPADQVTEQTDETGTGTAAQERVYETDDSQPAERGVTLTIRKSDGTTTEINAADIDTYDDATVGTIVHMAMDGKSALSVNELNLMLQTYKGGNLSNYIRAWTDAYTSGFYGYQTSATSTATLTSGVENLVHQAGADASQKAENARMALVKSAAARSSGAHGKLTMDAKINRRSLDANQNGAIGALRTLARATGVNFHIYKSDVDADGRYTGKNGYFDPNTNTIYIDVNAGRNYTLEGYAKLNEQRKAEGMPPLTVPQVAMLRTAAHELTHFIENNSAGEYAALRNYITNAYKSKGISFNHLVEQRIDASAQSGMRLTRAGAVSEVIADGCEMMLNDTELLNNLAKQDRNLFNRIRNFITEWAQKVQDAFLGAENPEHKEAKYLMDQDKSGIYQYSQELKDMWQTGLLAAVNNTQNGRQQSAAPSVENFTNSDLNTMRTGARNAMDTAEVSAEEVHPGSGEFSLRQFAEAMDLNLVETPLMRIPYQIVDKNGKPVTRITGDMVMNSPAGGMIAAAAKYGTISGLEAEQIADFYARIGEMAVKYKDAAMVWEIAGSELFSAIKNNSDPQYNTTVDFGTVCSKTQAIIDTLSETMMKEGRGLTRAEVIDAYHATYQSGQSVPCPVCYVFSRWIGVPSLLQSIKKAQDTYSNMSEADLTKYVDSMLAKYGDEKKLNDRKAKIQKQLDALAEQIQMRLKESRTANIDDLRGTIESLEQEMDECSAYNFVTQAILKRTRSGSKYVVARDSKGQVIKDNAYKPVPNEILFDLRRGDDFARGYEKVWLFRTTRGAGMGKAILPYSGQSLGDTVRGTAKRWERSQNPFLKGENKKSLNAIRNAVKRSIAQNLIGGLRMQSTSDFRPEWGIDYLMNFAEMQMIGSKAQLYTKVLEAVDMFSTVGAMVNMSIMPQGDGYITLADGTKKLVFSSITGIDFDGAYEKTLQYDNAQMILVGINDEHIRLALADDRITFVIPWHSSGNSQDVLKQLVEGVGDHLKTSSDYSDFQEDKAHRTKEQQRLWDLRTNILKGKYLKRNQLSISDQELQEIRADRYLNDLFNRFYEDETQTDTYHVKLNAQQAGKIFPYEYWDTNSTIKNADVNGQRFVEYCEHFGMTPRFAQFANDPGYWKLLIDRRMYDLDGNYYSPHAIDVTGLNVESIPQEVSQAKYGDASKQAAAVQGTIDRIRARAEAKAFPGYVDPDVETQAPVQASVRDTQTNETDQTAQEAVTEQATQETTEVQPNNIQASVRDFSDLDTDTETVTETPESIEAGIQASVRDNAQSTETVWDYLEGMSVDDTQDAVDARFLTRFQNVLGRYRDAQIRMELAQGELETATTQDERILAQNHLSVATDQYNRLYRELTTLERDENMRDLEGRSRKFINDYLADHSVEEVGGIIAEYERTVTNQDKQIADLKKTIEDTKRVAGAKSNMLRSLDALDNQIAMAEQQNATKAQIKQLREQFERELKAAKAKGAEEKQLQHYKDLNELRQAKEKAQDTIKKLRATNAQKLLEQQNYYRDMLKKNKGIRDATLAANQSKRKIGRTIRQLDGLIRRETDYKNVPEELKPLVETVLKMFASHDADGNRIVFNREMAEILNTEYRRLLDRDDIGAMLDEDVADQIADLAKNFDLINAANTKGVSRLERAQQLKQAYESIADIVTYFKNMVARQQEVFIEGQRQKISDLNAEITGEMNQRRNNREYVGPGSKVVKAADKAIHWYNLTPAYFFRRLNNTGMMKLWNELHEGENQYGLQMQKAKDAISKIQQETNYFTWSKEDRVLTFDGSSGRHIKLTTEQAMAAWATWKREQLNGMGSKHLEQGGYVLPEEYNNDKKLIREKQARNVTGTKLNDADMKRIADFLTEEQKEYVRRMVDFLSNDMSQLGNEVSMKLYGIKKFKESFYYPFKSFRNNLYQKSDAGSQQNTNNDNRAKSKGFTKSLTAFANNAVLLEDFSKTVADHISEMITYNSMVMPIENLNRILNAKTFTEDGVPITTRSLIQLKYGDNALGYMQDLMATLNGGIRSDHTEGAAGAMLTLFKKGAVSGSLSVAAQQPLSYIRAATLINPKYLARSAPDVRGTAYEEAKKYAGTAVIKDIGGFDVGTGKSNSGWLLENEELTIGQKAREALFLEGAEAGLNRLDELAGILPEKADAMTWGQMWKAIKMEQADLHRDMDVTSDEFLELCGRRFNDVMTLTQVYDSALSKSLNLQSKSLFMKMTQAFMNEPVLTANLLYDAFTNIKNKDRENHISAHGAIVATVCSALLQAGIKGMFTAGRKKDPEKTIWEKWAAAFSQNALDELNPLNLLPLVKDAVAILQGDSVERTDLSVISEVYDAFDKWQKGKITDPYSFLETVAGAVAKLAGVPLKNVMRDIRGTASILDGITGIDMSFIPGVGNAKRATNWQNVQYSLLEGLPFVGNKYSDINTSYDYLYDLMKNGNTEEAANVQNYLVDTKGKKDTTVTAALRYRVLDDYMAGGDGDELAKFMVEHGMSDNVKQAWQWLYKNADAKAHEDDPDYKADVYNPLREALLSYDQNAVDEVSEELTSHGVTEYTLDNKKQSIIGDWYADGTLTREEAEDMLRKQTELVGEDDLYWFFDKLDHNEAHSGEDDPYTFESESYSYHKWHDLFDAVSAGDTARMDAEISRLGEHGEDEDSARSKAVGYIGAQWMDGTMSSTDATKAYMHLNPEATSNDLYWFYDNYQHKKDHENDKGYKYSRYQDFYDLVLSGKDASAEFQRIAEHTNQGTNKSQVKAAQYNIGQAITSRYKSQLVKLVKNGQTTEAANLQAQILDMYVAAGYKRADRLKLVQGWYKDVKK